MLKNCSLSVEEWTRRNCIKRQLIYEELKNFGIDIPKFDVSGTVCDMETCEKFQRTKYANK